MTKGKRSAKKKAATEATPSVVAKVVLTGIRLLHSETKLEIKEGRPPEKSRISMSAEVGASRDDKTLRGIVSCAVDSFYGEDSEPSVFVHCRFELLYGAGNGGLPTKAEVKAQQNSVFSMLVFQVWPYLREFLYRSYLDMSLPPFLLPPVRLGANDNGVLGIQLPFAAPEKRESETKQPSGS